MDSGYYAAFVGARSKMQALDVAANNLANTSTVGYKSHQEFYTAVVTSMNERPLSALNRAVNNYGVLAAAVPNLEPGELEPTNNDLDVAIEGPGFFAVQTPAGVRYTRNGSFRLTATRQLATGSGDLVLGEKEAGKLGPIDIPAGQVTISADGTISVGDAVAAKLHIAEFAPGTDLTPQGNNYFIAPPKSEQPSSSSAVRQGFLEASNQNPVTGAVDLMLTQRQTEMLMRALSIFHTEFNEIAARDLGRV